MDKMGMVCQCGLTLSAPSSAEKALVAAIKFHTRTEHNLDADEKDIRSWLKPM